MTKAKIKITFKDGSVGWYVDADLITSKEAHAPTFTLSYAQGLAQGLNDAIKIYEDAKTEMAEVVII